MKINVPPIIFSKSGVPTTDVHPTAKTEHGIWLVIVDAYMMFT